MTDHAAIAERLTRAGLRPPTVEQVRAALRSRFGAEHVPTSLLSDEDHANDDRMLPGHERELWSITDPAALDRIADDEERAQVLPDDDVRAELAALAHADELDDDRRYARTLIEHGGGRRTSVLLQWAPERPDVLTAFVAYGVLGSWALQRYHEARFGVPGMRSGDLDDPAFRVYLELVEAEGLLP